MPDPTDNTLQGEGGPHEVPPPRPKRPADQTIGERRHANVKLDQVFALKQLPQGHTNQARYTRNVREMGREFAGIIMENTPECADRSTAIRKVREAVLWATEAIMREGLI